MIANERLVPKVHPVTRAVEAEDPMELIATPATGDATVMLECIVQEFAFMGCDEEQLMGLFRGSDYPVLAGLRAAFGEDEIRRQLRVILDRQGVFHVRERIDDGPNPDELEPELIQIGVRQRH
jgi:hypothetical protein